VAAADPTDPIGGDNPPRRLGLLGWLGGGRRGLEAYLYVLHRLSGLALLLFLSMHIFVTSVRLFGEEAWATLLETTHSPVFQFLEYLAFAGFAFHAINGVRLLIVELGFGIGRPDQPVYPYRGSVHRQRPLMIVTMVLAAVLIALGGFELLRFP
jgi:succinate dehydrogenase / fumarate reductase cytochrome b subunit